MSVVYGAVFEIWCLKNFITIRKKLSLFSFFIYKIAISEISDQRKNEKNAIISIAEWWVKSDFPKTPW